MHKTSVLIFGNNEYGLEIARNVKESFQDITIFGLDETGLGQADSVDYNIEKFDLSDDWDEVKHKHDLENAIIFCVLNDEAENIFLTISLRSSFENITIIALASNNEDANKLRIAGANKVIPIVETTADIITNMLKKPVMTEVLHDILYENTDLKVEQIKVHNSKHFEGKYPTDIDWNRFKGIIILSIIHQDMSSEFIYSSKAEHHIIQDGDIFVVVGYDQDIRDFETSIGNDNG